MDPAQLTQELFEGTLIFMVDGHNGHLLASSTDTPVSVPPVDSPSGVVTGIKATESNDTVVRSISLALTEPWEGDWAHFLTLRDARSLGNVAGYFVTVQGISFQVAAESLLLPHFGPPHPLVRITNPAIVRSRCLGAFVGEEYRNLDTFIWVTRNHKPHAVALPVSQDNVHSVHPQINYTQN